MRLLFPALAVAAIAAYLATRSGTRSAFTLPDGWADVVPAGWAGFDSPELEADQAGPTLFDRLAVTLDPSTYLPAGVSDQVAAANTRAFLEMLKYSEGATYDTLYGGGKFVGFADHPRTVSRISRTDQRWTSAAGAYQFMAVSPIPGTAYTTKVDTWDRLKRKLELPDFSPASQDAAAIELIAEKGALRDVEAGRFAMAIDKVRAVWASLPGAGYNQPERSFTKLLAVYRDAGGATSESTA